MAKFDLNREMEEFWLQDVVPAINQLFEMRCTFMSMSTHFLENKAMIENRYGLTPTIELFGVFPKDMVVKANMFSPFSCYLEESHPRLVIILPELKRYFSNINSHGNGDAWLAAQIGFIHETDHIALGLVCQKDSIVSEDKKIEVERCVWARTSEKCLMPLVRSYQQKLPYGLMLAEAAWWDCGRDEKSQKWENFISSIYA